MKALAAAALAVVALVGVGVGVGVGARSALACAGCRNPNLPVTRLSVVQLGPGEARVSAALSATALHVVHQAGCADSTACQEVPVQPRYLHDQRLFPGELRAIGELGLTRALGLEAHLPFRVVVTAIDYTTPDGAPYEPLDRDVHHRDETLGGLGDPWLLLRAGALWGEWLIQGRLGTSLPLGRTEDDPFVLGARGERHQHVQLGTGTFDPIVAADVARRIGPANLGGYLQGQISPYENRHGFRAGLRLLAGVQGGIRLGRASFGALLLDVAHDGPERWGGVVQQDGMLGRTELLGGISLSHSWGPSSVALVLRAPLYRHVIAGDEPAGRLSSPLSLGVTVGRTFGR